MEPQEILQKARQPGDPPRGWTIIPLNRAVVQRAILGWVGGALVGLILFGLLLSAVYTTLTIFPIVFLALLAFIGLGSLYLTIKYSIRLTQADRYLIVMTPELFVQQKGQKVVNVPMDAIEHITLRGVFGGDASYTQLRDQDVDNAVLSIGRILGGSPARRARRTPDSLAFVDARTDTIIQIADDNSFAELPVLEELLRTYVDSARRARKN